MLERIFITSFIVISLVGCGGGKSSQSPSTSQAIKLSSLYETFAASYAEQCDVRLGFVRDEVNNEIIGVISEPSNACTLTERGDELFGDVALDTDCSTRDSFDCQYYSALSDLIAVFVSDERVKGPCCVEPAVVIEVCADLLGLPRNDQGRLEVAPTLTQLQACSKLKADELINAYGLRAGFLCACNGTGGFDPNKTDCFEGREEKISFENGDAFYNFNSSNFQASAQLPVHRKDPFTIIPGEGVFNTFHTIDDYNFKADLSVSKDSQNRLTEGRLQLYTDASGTGPVGYHEIHTRQCYEVKNSSLSISRDPQRYTKELRLIYSCMQLSLMGLQLDEICTAPDGSDDGFASNNIDISHITGQPGSVLQALVISQDRSLFALGVMPNIWLDTPYVVNPSSGRDYLLGVRSSHQSTSFDFQGYVFEARE